MTGIWEGFFMVAENIMLNCASGPFFLLPVQFSPKMCMLFYASALKTQVSLQ